MRSILALLSAVTVVGVANAVETLAPFKYGELPLGSIKPLGWLKDQIQLSADGLGGHEWDFYRLVRNTTWTNGTYEYSGLRESAPYWFNYIVPLAYTSDDARLKAQAKEFLDHVLETQWEDGWLGPEETPAQRGIWARALLIYGLSQYADAVPEEADRIVTAIHKFVNLAATMLKNDFTGLLNPQPNDFSGGNHGKTRAHEIPTVLQWLYDKHPRGNEENIWTVMDLMFQGGIKAERDWRTFLVEDAFPKLGTPNITDYRFVHGVDISEGLRWTTALYRLDKDENNVALASSGFDLVFKYHGASSGTVTADELLGGLSPTRGSELCMAVEAMFSGAYLYRFHGLNKFADRAELIAFNAFPAQMTGDWWAHQYVAQPNQPFARKQTSVPYANVGTYGTVFGLEPNYPCCTVNHPQAYPKFVANSWVKTGANGLIHVLLSPSEVKTTLADSNAVTVSAVTNYPFHDTITYTTTADKAFELYLRVPSWAVVSESTVTINRARARRIRPSAESLQLVRVPAGKSTVTFKLSQKITVEQRQNAAVAVHRGPLLYALDLDYDTTSIPSTIYYNPGITLPGDQLYLPYTKDHFFTPKEAAADDWRVAINTSSIEFVDAGAADSLPKSVFDEGAPPVSLKVQACKIEWGITSDILALAPEGKCTGEVVERVMRPYGSTKIRMTEVPEMV